MYFAQTTDKHEVVQFRTRGETREDAALAVFALDPQAKVCKTTLAMQLKPGEYHNTGRNIQFHRPSDFPTPEYS